MTAPVFTHVQSFWDAEGSDLMWVVVKSEGDADGDYAVRLWFSLDGSDPSDETNEARQLAVFDPDHLDEAPDEAAATTVARGLKANRTAFGLPWLARGQGVHTQRLMLWIQTALEESVVSDGEDAPD